MNGVRRLENLWFMRARGKERCNPRCPVWQEPKWACLGQASAAAGSLSIFAGPSAFSAGTRHPEDSPGRPPHPTEVRAALIEGWVLM
jgi:hypothetical protein